VFRTEFPEDVCREVLVSLSPQDIESVLRNLLDNAVESLKGRGTVTLAAGSEGTSVWIEVRDQGVGMRKDEIEDSLRPFYTTKPDGSGIGLPLARRLVELAGGSLTITSRPARGTRVRIELPGRLAGSETGE
jgi:signal transduction histidine kinase